MRSRLAKGVLNISIEVLATGDRQPPLEHDATLSIIRLAELLDRYQMPATFAVGEPAPAALLGRLASDDRGHEIALLGDGSWLAAGRGRLARELAARLAAIRQWDLEATTIVLAGQRAIEHHDLAVRYGIRAIRASSAVLPRTSRQPHAVRFGLWSLAVGWRLPSTRWWGGGARAARARLDRAIAERGAFGLAIDAGRLAERGAGGLRVIERVLKHAVRRRDDGSLDVLTLGETAARLSSPVASRPTRSILRPAA